MGSRLGLSVLAAVVAAWLLSRVRGEIGAAVASRQAGGPAAPSTSGPDELDRADHRLRAREVLASKGLPDEEVDRQREAFEAFVDYFMASIPAAERNGPRRGAAGAR